MPFIPGVCARHTGFAAVTFALVALPAPAFAGPYDNLVPGQWTVVSTNTIRDLDPCPARNCSYSAVEGVSAVVNDWCGGAFASGFGMLGGMVAWGGGHNGYFGSEVYVFDLATQQWARVTSPYDDGSASVAPSCSADGIYPDGSACPTHTYNSIEYHPATDRLVILNGTPDPRAGGAVDGRAHLFDFTSHTWRLGAKVSEPVGYDAPGVYDAKRDLFWHLYGYTNNFLSYDPNRDAWKSYGSPGSFEIDGAGRIDPLRDLFIFIDARGSAKVYAIPLSSPTTPFVELHTSGDVSIQSATQMGFEWDPIGTRFVAWNDGSDVYLFTPPAGDWRAGTWVWTRVPPDPGNSVVPTRNQNGTYGRFRYAPSVNAFLLFSAYDGPVWAYRLAAGAGTGPNPSHDAGLDGSAASSMADASGADGAAGANADGAGNGDASSGALDGGGPSSSRSHTNGGCSCRSAVTGSRCVDGLAFVIGLAVWRRRTRREPAVPS